MKLARCTDGGATFWAAVDPEADIAHPIVEPFAEWAPRLTSAFEAPLKLARDTRRLGHLRLLAPLNPGAVVVGLGATYAKHVEGIGLQMPKQPAAFLKTDASIIGPNDEIGYPEVTKELDYEGELVAVVGATSISDRARATQSILGYTVGNDVTARDQQFSGGVTGMDLFSGKALDRTSGLGPWIVTRDEFGDEHPDLDLELTVENETRQHDRTSSMVWGVGELCAYVDARMRLHCGDVMFTGTCAGVAHEDGRYLEPGQVVNVTIERVGSLCNSVGPRPG
jgi:2-keto-4-pentenoate hydratase/2-oxohepta-3-ene-1,7-dioic acid hydratase in catechol pathway